MPCLTIQATTADNLTGRVNGLPGPALTGLFSEGAVMMRDCSQTTIYSENKH